MIKAWATDLRELPNHIGGAKRSCTFRAAGWTHAALVRLRMAQALRKSYCA